MVSLDGGRTSGDQSPNLSSLKYLRLGPALMVRTGTTKRNPSADATSPPPHACAKGLVVGYRPGKHWPA
jgi:hypothetical protein